MGCVSSNEDVDSIMHGKIHNDRKSCGVNSTSANSTYGENAPIDLSHFSDSDQLLGLGGFGIVRLVTKLSGCDKNQAYALKSLSKAGTVCLLTRVSLT